MSMGYKKTSLSKPRPEVRGVGAEKGVRLEGGLFRGAALNVKSHRLEVTEKPVFRLKPV